MKPTLDDTRESLLLLLTALAGPNYSGALSKGDIPSQIDRCINWVRAEASEAVSLIESCVPHGKPMLAQARRRLEGLEALKTLELVVSQHFGEI